MAFVDAAARSILHPSSSLVLKDPATLVVKASGKASTKKK